MLVGPSLIWARGHFEQKTIQVNKYNRLSVEIHSKIPDSIRIARVYLRFNDPSLNFDVTSDFQLAKKSHITVSKELYISKENNIKVFNIQLQEVIIELAPVSSDCNGLSFALKPYL